MPDGISRSTVFLPAMTSVWPALCPPWKRTTPCACSVSQSTTLPLPSSPHCVPITTTFLLAAAIVRSLSGDTAQRGELAQVEREAGRRPRAPERFADTVVAFAAADRIGFALGEHRKTRAGLVVIAAQIREIDMQRGHLRAGGQRKRFQRRHRDGDR